ncbi:anti-repressor SinI family protein [Bacillus thermotolerans]|uniref:Sin domain-containing protein n=1 Tax=Bacillus thermotolerans TaxID=1221996 RepID=A0A0F5HQC8_BACTR|nr:anti-repressor SinI family protein [Bacillus thermotolerans]KKB35483.1 hypothetical protein QY97_01661 [Bacillus thermotolerans]KKB40937.1 hypothetical protein QY95_01000 [Bacillus thermotolerans]
MEGFRAMDQEWISLMKEAKEKGLTVGEVRRFLKTIAEHLETDDYTNRPPLDREA